MQSSFELLKAFTKRKLVNVVIETPRGSRNKFNWDSKRGILTLHSSLPTGMCFPYDFGFIPGTLADDGDPLDALVLLSDPGVVGCVIEARPIGIVKLKEGTKVNDRVIAVWPEDPLYGTLEEYSDLGKTAQKEIADFFVTYPRQDDRKIRHLGEGGAAEARKIISSLVTN